MALSPPAAFDEDLAADAELEEEDRRRHSAAADGFSTLDEFLAWAETSREKSLAEQLATLPEAEQEVALEGLDPEALLYSWETWARPSQLLPADDWTTALLMAGRGHGKTRTGAEWIREKARRPNTRFLLLGRTSADVRDVMVNGESGIVNISPPSERPEHLPSRRLLVWPNGSQALLMSSFEPSLLRGPQAHYSWADEVGTYSHLPDDSGLTAWQNLRIATRLGDHPQVLTTTTPKRLPAVSELLDEANDPASGTIVIRGRTIDNVTALSRQYLATLFNLYHGTTLWAQEILGELVTAAAGALWSDELLEKGRRFVHPSLPLRVVAVDPSVAQEPRDECGIVVVGGTAHRSLDKRHAYVLEDASLLAPPAKWAKAVVEAAHRWNVAAVVAEGNQGGALVAEAIHNIDPDLKVVIVHARQNKQLRAEPVVTAYEGGRVHHFGHLPELEAQLTSWEPGVTKKSPDRLDALVYGVAALLINPPKGLVLPTRIRAKSAARRHVPGVRRTDAPSGARRAA